MSRVSACMLHAAYMNRQMFSVLLMCLPCCWGCLQWPCRNMGFLTRQPVDAVAGLVQLFLAVMQLSLEPTTPSWIPCCSGQHHSCFQLLTSPAWLLWTPKEHSTWPRKLAHWLKGLQVTTCIPAPASHGLQHGVYFCIWAASIL